MTAMASEYNNAYIGLGILILFTDNYYNYY